MDTRMCMHTHICAHAHTHKRSIHPVSHMQCTVNILLLTKRSLNTLTKNTVHVFISCVIHNKQFMWHQTHARIPDLTSLHDFMQLHYKAKQKYNMGQQYNRTSYKSVQAPFTTAKQIMVKTHFGVCGWGAEGGNRYDAKAKDKCLQNWHIE